MKIAFVGGGSVQWTMKLATDIALNTTLANADLTLHDIDADALALLTRACERIAAQAGDTLRVRATRSRADALRDADFVILCVSIGKLEAMRYDLAIPERYGIYQSVGDTVGPGGLARGLRHIPFALRVAREMEQLCPRAWLLNLTNPMTTICRGVTRATSIRTIGLCHEVTGVRRRLAALFGVPVEAIRAEVAGINHLPVLLRLSVGSDDGLALLHAWLAEHSPLEFRDEHLPTVRDIFHDRLAVKFSLFEQLGILFGAGDRHVAEFFAGFLSEENARGNRYGVVLTTIAHREELERQRRADVERFVAGAGSALQPSDEQLAGVMAALAGGAPGEFIVNVPNVGQIDDLPRGAVVECLARVDALGAHPHGVGALPLPAYAAVAPHVARQELIVESALTGARAPARAALATDPLVRDPAIVQPLLDELLAANARFMTPEFLGE